MFEAFVFINPIGLYCYDTEKLLMEVSNELGLEVYFHFMTIVDTVTLQADVIRRKTSGQSIGSVSKYTISAYRALEDYHAIKLAYGNKKARDYIFNLQKKVSNDLRVYDPDMPNKIITELKMKPKKVLSYRNSEFIADSISHDQKIAEQWQITNTPSTVIINEKNSHSGFLFEGCLTRDELLQILEIPKVHTHKQRFRKITTPHSRNLRLI